MIVVEEAVKKTPGSYLVFIRQTVSLFLANSTWSVLCLNQDKMQDLVIHSCLHQCIKHMCTVQHFGVNVCDFSTKQT